MHGLNELGRRLLMLSRRRRFDADLEEEMRLHLPAGPASNHDSRTMPGNPSNRESKLKIRSIPCCSMTARWRASRADSRR